jgi:hypothetical protein
MSVPGQVVLEMFCGSCFRPNCRNLHVFHCEKPHFPPYLGVGLSMSIPCSDGGLIGHL